MSGCLRSPAYYVGLWDGGLQIKQHAKPHTVQHWLTPRLSGAFFHEPRRCVDETAVQPHNMMVQFLIDRSGASLQT
ncbi:hypothetical protein Q8A67_019882 [Cirrhinus molitorella]|uniref:Uncharacterized protein n=1 Tax=Cirrhinus molitorella TaxID=172907 RepID=A0AA88PME0_9TELE|nr:hypothetical protein Q8A67_019882 [Cirrhinus molitorella]